MSCPPLRGYCEDQKQALCKLSDPRQIIYKMVIYSFSAFGKLKEIPGVVLRSFLVNLKYLLLDI